MIRSKFAFLAAAMLSLSGPSGVASEQPGASGFQMLRDGLHATTWSFRDELTLIISKGRFKTEKKAKEFCKSYRSVLDTDFNSLLIAMSGASNESKFLSDTISFRVNGRTGIWQWLGKDRQILILLDGEGMREKTIGEDEIEQISRDGVPAICTSKL
jgi:hypothetical protein